MDKGYTQTENDFLAWLYCSELCYETRVMIFLIRKIKGFHKKSDKISYNEITTATGIDRRRVIEVIKKLEQKKIIKVKRKNKCINIISFVGSAEKRTRGSAENGINLVRKSAPTKESTKATSTDLPLGEAILEEKENTDYWLEEDFDD